MEINKFSTNITNIDRFVMHKPIKPNLMRAIISFYYSLRQRLNLFAKFFSNKQYFDNIIR